jgi:V/A-type H+-transporting ATPase subunit D
VSSASRSRLLELRADLAAATRGRDVLERKRELYLLELRRRTAELRDARRPIEQSLGAARAAMTRARVELGRASVEAAVLAQPENAAVELRSASVLGTRVPRLAFGPGGGFHPGYGPLGTAASLDEAGAAFAEVLPRLVRLAELEAARAALRRGLRKTARRLVALERVIVPRFQAELAAVVSGLEEDERDEAVRRRAWLAARRAVS